jgi:drug/metabolite transporter (DMT)-like permease
VSGQNNAHAITAMTAAMALFVLNNAAMKLAAAAMPVSQAVTLRGLMAIPLILAVIGWRGEAKWLPHVVQPVILLRALFDTLNALMFLSALTVMSLADDVAIQQIVPLLIIAYAALAWRQRIGWPQLLAILAGLAGALLIARPTGAGLQSGALLAFGATLAVAGRDIATAYIDRKVPSLVATLSATILLTLAAAAFAPFDDWVMPEAKALPLLAAAAVLITSALVAVTLAFRWAKVHVVTPFYYLQTVFAVGVTYVVFGTAPSAVTLAGMTLVILAGLAALRLTVTVSAPQRVRPAGPARAAPAAIPVEGRR